MDETQATERTKPRPRGADPTTHKALLLAERYGTLEMGQIWGAEKTFDFSLYVQGVAALVMSEMYPDVVPPEHAREIADKANLRHVSADRIRELELRGSHDVIAINTALEEVLSPEAAAHVNKAKTSADTTEPAKALQIKRSVDEIIVSLENLRDITLERAFLDWSEVPHMDVTHWYDALPTVFGRPFVFYAEMLQFGIDELARARQNSIIGKWADATGNHHSATALGIDGIALQKEYCRKLGMGYMTAPAQIPGREFIYNIVTRMMMAAGTMQGLAKYIRWGRSHDVGLLKMPLGKKGSSGMPHKDMVGGNPDVEEQAGSYHHYMLGILTTAASTIPFNYGRDLEGSASDRINLEGMFKFGDHSIRRLADVMSKLLLDEKRSVERFERTYGTTTSQRVMTYLTDRRRVERPLTRRDAHDLTGKKLAVEAYTEQRPYFEVCMEDETVRSMISEEKLRELTDPFTYTGESKHIIRDVYNALHGKKTPLD